MSNLTICCNRREGTVLMPNIALNNTTGPLLFEFNWFDKKIWLFKKRVNSVLPSLSTKTSCRPWALLWLLGSLWKTIFLGGWIFGKFLFFGQWWFRYLKTRSLNANLKQHHVNKAGYCLNNLRGQPSRFLCCIMFVICRESDAYVYKNCKLVWLIVRFLLKAMECIRIMLFWIKSSTTNIGW